MNGMIGKEARFVPCMLRDKDGGITASYCTKVTGRVSFVNEAHSYFTVSFRMFGLWFRESFKFSQIGKDVEILG